MNKARSIYIWVESGKKIGMGHVNRCLVIAEELKLKGFQVLFLVNDDPVVITRVNDEGFQCKIASLETFLQNGVIEKNGNIVIIDKKKTVTVLIKQLRTAGYKVILLDNVTTARLDSDMVIYPAAIFVNDLDWDGFIGKVYYGADYVPIARSFITAKPRLNQIGGHPPYRILVTMGGSDSNHLTRKVVSSLLEFNGPIHLDVVIGPAFSHDSELEKIEHKRYDNISFIRNNNDLSFLMAESYMAITALGTTLYELAYMEIPALIIANYREDERDMNAFKKLGTALPLGYHEDVTSDTIRHAVETLINDKILWEAMSHKGKIDGRGAERIASLAEELLIPVKKNI